MVQKRQKNPDCRPNLVTSFVDCAQPNYLSGKSHKDLFTIFAVI